MKHSLADILYCIGSIICFAGIGAMLALGF